MITPLSTRLFPKDLGADRYVPTGIAKKCDWVVLSDHQTPETHLVRQTSGAPRFIFVSLRVPRTGLKYFADEVLPQLRSPFVLISGSEDATLPRQIDVRQQPFRAQEQDSLARILDHPMLRHWFVENLDRADWSPKVSPLPVGMVYTNPAEADQPINVPTVDPLMTRPLKVLCGHRIREGDQWTVRREVTALARQDWAEFCTVIDTSIPEAEFTQLMQTHAFVLCVEGGGLDPSPKAWQSILNGAVPIIRRSAVSKAYDQLPVMIIEDWAADGLSVQKLVDARNRLLFDFDTISGRKQTLKRLDIDYWWQQITAAFAD